MAIEFAMLLGLLTGNLIYIAAPKSNKPSYLTNMKALVNYWPVFSAISLIIALIVASSFWLIALLSWICFAILGCALPACFFLLAKELKQ